MSNVSSSSVLLGVVGVGVGIAGSAMRSIEVLLIAMVLTGAGAIFGVVSIRRKPAKLQAAKEEGPMPGLAAR